MGNVMRSGFIAPCLALVCGLGVSQAMADNPGGWEYSVAPLYLWGKNIEGTAAIGGKEAPLDLDFKDDILENLESAFALHVEAKQGPLTLFAEYNYAKLEPEAEESLGPITVTADVKFRDTMFEAGVAYAFYESETTQWEVLGAYRYMEQEIDVAVGRPGLLPLPIPGEISGGDDWGQGIIGTRYTGRLSQRWSFRGRADVGYGGSDNQSVQLLGMFDYRFRDWGSFFAGYRFLDTDFDNGRSGTGGYAFDGDQQGPLIGLNFHF